MRTSQHRSREFRAGPRLAAGGLLAGVAAAALSLALVLVAGPAFAASPAAVPPPSSWNLSLRSTAYLYQIEATRDGSVDEQRFYQYAAGGASGLAGGWLSLRASGRFANAPAGAAPWFDTSRLYSGYLEVRLGSRSRARVGRQFLQAGVAALTLDGAEVSYGRGGPLEAAAWGGARAPYGSALALGDFDRDAAAGARVVVAPDRRVRLAFSGAYRERAGAVAERPVGCEVATTAVRRLTALARAAYDLESDRWARLEAQARWLPAATRPAVTLQYVDRRPSIDAASWFARFDDLGRIRLARGAVRWESRARYGGELEYVGSFVEERAASRLGVALLLPVARVGWSIRTGDAGEENGVYGEAAWQVRPWLRLEGEASYLTYALLQDAPAAQERDLTSLAARARARLRPGLDITAELQRLDNPLYDSDVRLLLGVDLAMARGASRLGLDRGGWRR